MKILITSLFLTLIIGFTSCKTSSKVVSFTNDNIKFENYKTYQIVNHKKGEDSFSLQGEAFITKIESGINSELTSKSYESSNNPDMLVRYEIISSIQIKTNNNYNDPYNNTSFNRNYQYNTPINNTTKQMEGILLIELKDSKSKKLIWQGSLDLKYSRKTDKNEDLLLNAIQTIFLEYNYEAGNQNSLDTDSKK